MAVTVPNQWTHAEGDIDCEVITNPTPGDWLVAVVAVRVSDSSTPTITVGDIARGPWSLLATDTLWANATHAAASMQVEVWACPAVHYEGWPWLAVYSAANQITGSDVGSHVINLFEVAGMSGALTVDSIVPVTASATASLSISIPAPAGAASCLMVAAAAIDLNTATLTATGSGFTALTQIGSGAPDLKIGPQWKVATTAQTATWTSSVAVDWAGVAVSFRVAGTTPVQPNANWPATSFQVGLGYDLNSPLSRVRWTDQTTRFLSLGGDRGIQAELGATEQGTGDVLIRNDDGAYSPRAVVGAASATAAGTVTTIKVAAATTPLNVGDFFRLQTAAGALKELNVFQVTALSTAGGTTTVTFARADGTAGGAKAATATGDVYAGVQIDMYIPYRLLMTWSGTPYVVASGWLRDLPLVYQDAAWAEVQAQGGDAIETLTAASPTALAGEILRRSPTHYWPLNDGQGGGVAANASGVTTSVLAEQVSKWGGGSASADFGASTQDVASIALQPNYKTSLIGDSGTGWAQTGGVAADLATKGYALVGVDAAFPAISSGITIIGNALVVDPDFDPILNAAADPTVVILRNGDPGAGISGGSIFKLQVSRTTLKASITKWDQATHAQTTTANIGSLQIATASWVPWALVLTSTTWKVYVQGQLQGSGTCNLVPNFTQLDIGGEADQFYSGRSWGAVHAHVAVFGRALTATEISNLDYSATVGHLPNEYVGSRIQKKLNTTGWKGTRVINRGYSFSVAEEGDSGATIADLANEVVTYEDSLVFADAASQLQYRSAGMGYHQTPRVVLGELTAAGEIPYKPGMQPGFNPSFIYNSVEVDQTAAGSTSTLFAVDDNSAKKYGTRGPLQRATRLGSDYLGWHLGWWLLGRYAYPKQRVESITIAAHAYPAAWPTVLGIEVGDLVTVMRRQINAPVLAIPCRVLRVQPSIKFGGEDGSVDGSVTLTLAAAPPDVAICGDATYGQLAGTVLGL